MRKKVLALLLGGVMAVGGLFVSAPATVQAEEPCENPRNHISSWTLTPGNGQIAIQCVSNIPNISDGFDAENRIHFFLAQEEIEGAEDKIASDLSGEQFDDGGYEWSGYGEADATGSCVIKGLTNGTTYYVYAQIYFLKDADGNPAFGNGENVHTLLLMGSRTPDASLSNDPVTPPSDSKPSANTPAVSTPADSGSAQASDPGKTFEENLTNQVKGAEPGAMVVVEQGVTTLPNFVMKELLKRTDVSLKLEFTYQNTDYVIVIPAGQAVDNDIPLYGPLYLAQQYGNRAGADTSVGDTYEVRSGDCLSRIAAASNMTLQQLLAKNPQIKDPNKIVVGQKINR